MRDYWAYEAVVDTFIDTARSQRVEIDGHILRLQKDTAVLVTPPTGELDPHDIITRLPHPVTKFRTFPFTVDRDRFPLRSVKARMGYYADSEWTPGKTVQQECRRAIREGATATVVPAGDRSRRAELARLLHDWHEWAKERHPMCTTGHYRRMIYDDRFGFRLYRIGDRLLGAMGYCREGDEAAICFAKHVPGIWWLSGYLWADTVSALLADGVRIVNCGDTADDLKSRVGLKSIQQYKLTDYRALARTAQRRMTTLLDLSQPIKATPVCYSEFLIEIGNGLRNRHWVRWYNHGFADYLASVHGVSVTGYPGTEWSESLGGRVFDLGHRIPPRAAHYRLAFRDLFAQGAPEYIVSESVGNYWTEVGMGRYDVACRSTDGPIVYKRYHPTIAPEHHDLFV